MQLIMSDQASNVESDGSPWSLFAAHLLKMLLYILNINVLSPCLLAFTAWLWVFLFDWHADNRAFLFFVSFSQPLKFLLALAKKINRQQSHKVRQSTVLGSDGMTVFNLKENLKGNTAEVVGFRIIKKTHVAKGEIGYCDWEKWYVSSAQKVSLKKKG
jgi:hypothetical protein